MSYSEDQRAAVNALHDSIQRHLSDGKWEPRYQRGLLQGWVLVSEWFSEDGERYLDHCVSEDTRTWTIQGYLHSVLDDITAYNIKHRDDEDR